MLPIYICDDDRTMLRYLKEQIEKQILIQEYDMTVAFCGTDPEELLAHLRQNQTKRNLYFLDVELKHKKYDGFLLGKEIRETDPHGTMIYITSFGNLAYKTFQYHLEAFDYITKDTPEKVSESLTACMRSVAELMVKENADPMDYYTVKTGERFCHVPIEEIDFFETSSRSHFVVLHARRQRIEFSGNLSDIEAQLAPAFLKVHRSYLVASDKIEELDLKNNRIWINGKACPVSRKMKSKLLEVLSRTPSDTKL